MGAGEGVQCVREAALGAVGQTLRRAGWGQRWDSTERGLLSDREGPGDTASLGSSRESLGQPRAVGEGSSRKGIPKQYIHSLCLWPRVAPGEGQVGSSPKTRPVLPCGCPEPGEHAITHRHAG